MMRTSPAPDSAVDGEANSLRTPAMRRILGSSFIGSTIEFYDFLLYATAAAIVFPRVFFTDLDPALATFASFGTLSAGYLARPLGGVIFGHFGDRVGRKQMLVISMLLMGVATTSIGFLPTTAQIGALAPMLLVLLRVLQGVAVGGEWGGAMLIALEHAPAGRRGFAASFTNFGAPVGSVLAAAAFALVSLLPSDQFFSWGWRIPFLVSVVLVLLGLVIRLRVSESPLFTKLQVEATTRRVPIVEVFRRHPQRILIGLLAAMSELTISGIANAWAVNQVIELGVERTPVLTIKALSSIGLFATTLIAAWLCDRVGRKPIIIMGIAAATLWAYPMLLLIQSGTLAGFAIAVVVAEAIQGVILGPLAAYLAELFPTAVRFTGASLCFQGAATLGAGFAPVVATALLVAGGGSPLLFGAVWAGVLLICLIAVALAGDGRTRNLATLR